MRGTEAKRGGAWLKKRRAGSRYQWGCDALGPGEERTAVSNFKCTAVTASGGVYRMSRKHHGA